jgi:hypothetical protein
MREFDIATIPLQRGDWEYIESIHEITEGGAYGFLLEDPKDFHSTSTTAVTRTTGVMAHSGAERTSSTSATRTSRRAATRTARSRARTRRPFRRSMPGAGR